MTTRQFEKKIAPVLEKYGKYRVADHKVWKEKDQIFFSARFEPEGLRKEPWGVSAVFDKDGKLIKSSYGSRRDYMFAKILMRRIEAACQDEKEKQWKLSDCRHRILTAPFSKLK